MELHLLCLPQYNEQIEKNFANTNITLSPITLLSPEDAGRLHSVSNATKDVNFTQVAQQVCWDLRTLPVNDCEYGPSREQTARCACVSACVSSNGSSFACRRQIRTLSSINLNTTADELDEAAGKQVSHMSRARADS